MENLKIDPLKPDMIKDMLSFSWSSYIVWKSL